VSAVATAMPFLSVFDPEVSTEGGVDPLSLQATYERLAERIYPCMTVRMKRIRFVTAIAIGAEVCRPFRDELASEGKTPPWLVFEWHVIESLLRSGIKDESGDLWGDGIPGAMKVGRVVKAGQRLGAAAYLKTPKIFGFTGVYRRLATGLQVVDTDLLQDDKGYELLQAWEADQGLPGFVSGSGPGADLKGLLQDAIRQAMKEGHVCRSSNWTAWGLVGRHFHPSRAGARERKLHRRLLFDPKLRRNAADPGAGALSEELLKSLEQGGQVVGSSGEKRFFATIRKKCSEELAERLEAIDAYEGLCRILDDTFGLVRHLSTAAHCAPVAIDEFGAFRKGKPASDLLASLRPSVERVAKAFAGTGREQWVAPLLKRYVDLPTPKALADAVLEHHEEAQRNKPPDGKRAWVEQDSRGVCVRALYAVATPPRFDASYVHDYRTRTASDFLRDMRSIS
jgi:hypothetical protein